MPLRTFELFHGAVLAKLVRQDRPTMLHLIETKPSDSWATYRINDEVNLVIKYSANPRHPKREPDATAWQFTFATDQLKQVKPVRTWAALVCGSFESDSREMEVCLLDHDQITELLFLDRAGPESMTVKRLAGRRLSVTLTKFGGELIVARDRLHKWAVPGS